jgi:hypothetical protein
MACLTHNRIQAAPEKTLNPQITEKDTDYLDLRGRCSSTRHTSTSTASKIKASDTNSDQDRTAPPFTDGPIRIIMAHDGDKDCLAVLLDKELFRTIQDLAATQLDVLDRQRALEKAQYDVKDIECYGQKPEGFKDISQKALDLDRQRKELEEGIPELREARQRCESLEKDLLDPKLNLESLRDGLQRPMLQVFREANLLELPAIRPSVGPCTGRQAPVSDYSASSSSYMGPPKEHHTGCHAHGVHTAASEAESVRRNAIIELHRARNVLIEAQYKLDCRKQHYNEDLAYYHYNVAEGVWSFTMTEFDNRQVEKGQILTRRLIEAEAAFDNANHQVEAAGARSDAESSYYGDYFEPSLIGVESDTLETDIRPRVEDWQAGLEAPGTLENPQPTDTDPWEGNPVDVSDSRSAIAFDQYYRKHIDRWEGMRSAARKREDVLQEEVQNEDGRDRKRLRSW